MKNNKIVFYFFIFLFSCNKNNQENKQINNQEKNEDKKIILALDWTINTNHIGIYTALEKGYFKDEDLDLEIIQASNSSPIQMLTVDKVNFIISGSEDLIYSRSKDLPIVSIFAILNSNTSGFISLKKTNINNYKDLIGKKYGGWGGSVETKIIQSLIKDDADTNIDLSFENITLGNQSAINYLLNDSIDFFWVFYGHDVIKASLEGIDFNYLPMVKNENDILNFYTPVIATSETMIKDNPKIVKAFVKVITRGMKYAYDNPEESAKILNKSIQGDEKFIIDSTKYILKNSKETDKPFGYQIGSRWEKFYRWMIDNELVKDTFDTKDLFSNDFIYYQKEKA